MARVNSKLLTILPLLQTQLASVTGLATDYVYLSLEESEEFEFPGNDFLLVLTPRRFSLDQGVFVGGGVVTPKFDGTLDVTLWARYGVDQPYRADKLLTDVTLGILAKWDLVLKALLGFDPTVSTNQVLVEPMRAINWEVQPRKGKPGWAKIASSWELKWNQDVT